VADFFPTLHQREQSVAHPQHGTVQFRRQLEPGARATASATVRQMRTAQRETAPQLPEPSNPTPNFIDVNSDSESIVVNAPLSEVYHRCLRFEDFPAFINSISKMDRIDNTHFSCTSSINGEEVQSDVQIIMRVPDRRIAWRAASDYFRVGVVSFYPIGGGTKVTRCVQSSNRCSLLERFVIASETSKSTSKTIHRGNLLLLRRVRPGECECSISRRFCTVPNSDNAPASHESISR
jgi:hypothetical protein